MTVVEALPLLPHHHEPMAPIGFGLIAIVIFMILLLSVLAIGRGRPDRR